MNNEVGRCQPMGVDGRKHPMRSDGIGALLDERTVNERIDGLAGRGLCGFQRTHETLTGFAECSKHV
jgi:hypothetical protein